MNKLLTVGCATATFAALLTGAASNATANAPCGKTASDIDHSSYVAATSSAANIRTGSSTGCTSIGSLLAGREHRLLLLHHHQHLHLVLPARRRHRQGRLGTRRLAAGRRKLRILRLLIRRKS